MLKVSLTSVSEPKDRLTFGIYHSIMLGNLHIVIELVHGEKSALTD